MFLTESELFKRKYSSAYLVLKSYFCPRNANGDQKISLRRKERRKIIKYFTTLYTKNSKKTSMLWILRIIIDLTHQSA